MGVIGPIGRRVADVALMMDVLTTADPKNVSTIYRDAVRRDPPRLNIAFSLRPVMPTPLADEMRDAVHAVAGLLESLGHHVEEADPDYGNVRALSVPRYLNGLATGAAMLDEPARLERRTRTLVRLGRLISQRRLTQARARERDYTARVNELFTRYDVLVTPVIARAAPSATRDSERGAIANLLGSVPWIAFTQIWNVTGQPALTLPAGFDRDGMPVAVQLIGRAHDEALLLGLATQVETATPETHRSPLL